MALQPIATVARWDELVVPIQQLKALGAIVDEAGQRARARPKGGRGPGLAVLFAGPTGAGKTLAAEAIAARLGLPLFRIALGAVVGKSIGETEKNIARLFGEADAAGAVLLLDEADALFGKRSEVKDAHYRYANIATDDLLERIEAHGGLVILTTNLKPNLDSAFLRRLRFIVDFPRRA
jgi:SpoVK/Ycf46/Vps4 family AAA+-type ATPase